MKFEECIKNVSTTINLKRTAQAYVVDSRNLNGDELTQAILKTAKQYCDKDNISAALKRLFLSDKRDERILTEIILREILLNKDDYRQEQKLLDEELIAYEQEIINASNELDVRLLDDDVKFFKFVLDTAWEHGDRITPDEKNLIDKIRTKLNVTQKDYRIIEAKLGKFPKHNNQTHLRKEIDAVRKALQQN